MPETVLSRAALAHALRPRGVRLGERLGLGKIDLRGDPHDRSFMTAVGRVLDLLLPGEPCGSARKGQLAALWLGPDQWLLTCPRDEVGSLLSALRDALADVHSAITDVSDARIALRVAGPSARDVLAKGCPLDLHPRAFAAGSCAQSLLAKASVLIHLVDDDQTRGPAFDVYVARSFAHYLWMWLEDAGREYGVQIDAAP
ncbi:MAG TPA: sarcosine oxidase subunit gamma family protein [Geminicoccaceae bacterium]|nr:sarcosine oxidase subunit gamma family protein [Geminicoccaceae bacterium]